MDSTKAKQTHFRSSMEGQSDHALISHTWKGEEGLGLFSLAAFSYASDVDLLRNRNDSLVPENGDNGAENGDTGGVEPAGEAGADPLGLW